MTVYFITYYSPDLGRFPSMIRLGAFSILVITKYIKAGRAEVWGPKALFYESHSKHNRDSTIPRHWGFAELPRMAPDWHVVVWLSWVEFDTHPDHERKGERVASNFRLHFSVRNSLLQPNRVLVGSGSFSRFFMGACLV